MANISDEKVYTYITGPDGCGTALLELCRAADYQDDVQYILPPFDRSRHKGGRVCAFPSGS